MTAVAKKYVDELVRQPASEHIRLTLYTIEKDRDNENI